MHPMCYDLSALSKSEPQWVAFLSSATTATHGKLGYAMHAAVNIKTLIGNKYSLILVYVQKWEGLINTLLLDAVFSNGERAISLSLETRSDPNTSAKSTSWLRDQLAQPVLGRALARPKPDGHEPMTYQQDKYIFASQSVTSHPTTVGDIHLTSHFQVPSSSQSVPPFSVPKWKTKSLSRPPPLSSSFSSKASRLARLSHNSSALYTVRLQSEAYYSFLT